MGNGRAWRGKGGGGAVDIHGTSQRTPTVSERGEDGLELSKLGELMRAKKDEGGRGDEFESDAGASVGACWLLKVSLRTQR